ncbi:unnamed protein product [Paramecium sonneborni]|uniref:Glycoside hydrolase family 38 central domain-containing protein n=1 Tax=Paramecium sonneborni TaxID=65129 RepID=A0A8S1Q0Q9_9CILI|nr:unnamed protein product [Paramecium sonneborni]
MFLVLILLLKTQGYYLGQVSQIGSDLLEVYLFPHSHNDVGWLKTMNEYYNDYHGVKQIINSYIEELIKDRQKHFSQVEVVYFKKWWNEQNNTMKDIIKQLINNQQIEFLSGGWCMNDEATAYYEDIIDQMTLGHKFLLQNFNYTPSVGWQIDTFGHSHTQALFSSMMGFNAWFLGRIDQQNRQERDKQKALEFIIHSDQENSIFTHINYYGFYSSPKGFDFDISNPNRQYVSNENLELKSEGFDQYFKQQSKYYRGKILAHTLGMDFEWSNASSYFQQMDRIIYFVNNNTEKFKMSIQYATPQQYIQILNQQNITYPNQEEDFFPYSDHPHEYWSGFYSSRPYFKRYVKKMGRYFQQVKRFYSIIKMNNICKNICDESSISELAEALGTAQHHDAITGTAKQYVIDDYINQIKKAHLKMNNQIYSILNYLSNTSSTFHLLCHFNESDSCDSLVKPLSQNQSVIVTIIDTKINNEGNEYLKISIPTNISITVKDEIGNLIEGEIICINNQCILYLLRKIDNSKLLHKIHITVCSNNDTNIVRLEPKFIEINKDTKIFDKFYLLYKAYLSNSSSLSSGAYIFKPNGNAQDYGDYLSAIQFTGKMIQQIYIEKTTLKVWITKFKDQNIFSIDTFLDSVDISDLNGKEIVFQIYSDIQNNGVFYTDSNGLKLQKRIINHRDSWNVKMKEKIAGNYFPVNGVIMIVDNFGKQSCAILNDRAQGGSSLSEGVIELMLQRRLVRDDNKGLSEVLDEQEIYNGIKVGQKQMISHTVIFYNHQDQPNLIREFQYKQDLQPLLYFSTQNSITYSSLLDIFQGFLIKNSDLNLGKLYIEPWLEENQYLVRVHNMREEGILKLNFPKGLKFLETTLTGNQDLKIWKNKRLKWNESHTTKQSEYYQDDEVGPMKIKTWIVTI